MTRAPAQLPLLLLLLGGVASGAMAAPVIGPAQNLQVRRAVGPVGAPLADGWRVERWELAGERVDIHLKRDGGEATVALRGERGSGGAEADWLETRQGWLRSAPGVSAEALRALKTHMERPGPTVVWTRREGSSSSAAPERPAHDEERALRERQRLEARVSARLTGGELPEEELAGQVTGAIQLLLGGDDREVRRQLARPPSEVSTLEDGAFSVWVSAGHIPERPLPDLLEILPNEPRLLAMMAERAYMEGRYDAAGWWLDAALKTPLADGEVLRLAALFGWSSASERADVIPPAKPAATTILTSWTVCGALAWFLLLVAAIRGRRWRLGLALSVGLVVALVVLPPRAAVERPVLPDGLALPLAGGECASGPARFDGDALMVHLRCAEGNGVVLARARAGSDDAFAVTEHHAVSMGLIGGADRTLEPRLERAARRLTSTIREAEERGFRLSELSWTEDPPLREGWPDWRARSDAERSQHRVVAGLIAAAWTLLLFALWSLVQGAVSGWSIHKRTRGWLLAALGVAVAAHALAPERMVMVFGGYDLTTHLVDGVIPRYGAGALWTYGPWMWIFGHDHLVVQTVNRALGLLLVVVAWDLGRRLYPARPRALAIAAWAMALMPVIWRAHSSESIVVGPGLFVLLAMRALATDEDARPGEAAVWGAAAATARPEIALVVCALPVWVWWAQLRWRRFAPVGGLAALAGGLLIAVHLITVATTAQDLSASGALPALENPVVVALGSVLWVGIFANVMFTPLGLSPLLAAGVVGSLKTRRALATVGVSVWWILLTSVDLVEVSVPRLHVPALLVAAPLLGLGWEWLETRVRPGRGGRAQLFVAFLILAVSSGYNAYQVFKPTNEDVEEQIWRDALERLPEEARCLAVMGYGDEPPAEKTPRHNPLYLLRDRHAHVTVSHLAGISEAQGCGEQHYALIGLRCYADLREDGRPQPQGSDPLPVCARVLQKHAGEALFEREVTNHGDLAFELYPTGERLRVGLFRVTRDGLTQD